MRILHVSEVHWGGVVTLLRHFTDEQARHGHEVHLLAPPSFPRLPAVQQHNWQVARENPRTFVPAIRELHALARRLDADVVHLHSFVAGFLGRLPTRRSAERPVVYQPHAWAFDLYADPHRRNAIMRWERYAARRTSRVVANCADEIAEGRAQGINTPGSVLGIAVDTDYFKPPTPEERAAAKAAVGFAGRPMVLVIGRIAYQKAQDLLVAAWERFPTPNADLVLVGPGTWTELRRLTPRSWGTSLHYAGESSDVRPWLWAADVLAIPSRYETVSLVLGEAMATGLPVVATRFNGAEEAIIGGDLGAGGEVVQMAAMDDLLRACGERLQSPLKRHVESSNARRRAERHFSPEDVYARLQGAYEQAVGLAAAEMA
jgi:glycosyltransferase involved in cell wall biosynthesis